jgi:hypothetical protein
MQGVCSAQAASECQGARTFIYLLVLAASKSNPQTMGNLPAFGLRLEGLTMKLQSS